MDDDAPISNTARGVYAVISAGVGVGAVYALSSPFQWGLAAGVGAIALVAGWLLGPRLFELIFDASN